MMVRKAWYIFIDWFKGRRNLIGTCAELQHKNKMLRYALDRQMKINENSIKIQNISIDKYLALQQRFIGDPERNELSGEDE